MNDHEINDTETIEPEPSLQNSRRKFLIGSGGVAAAAAVLVACGDDDEEGGVTDGTTPGGGAADPDDTEEAEGGDTGDLEVARIAAGLEVLAVTAYDMVAQKASSGGLGEVPPAIVEFVTVVGMQHQTVLDQWNMALTEMGESEVTEPSFPPGTEITVEDAVAALESASDLPTVANLALYLEQLAAKTYFEAAPTLSDPVHQVAGGAENVDQMHASVLLFVLGEYPVPNTFMTELEPTPPS